MPYADPEAQKAYDEAYREKNRERIKARQRAWYLDNRTKVISNSLRNRDKRWYGITEEEYEDALHLQGGKCAICGVAPKKGRRLCVDHCHCSGRFRGLLCDLCNKGLGQFKDDREVLARAIAYLGTDG